ncbi:amidase [Geodermatophilus dictyosporus]|uniref:Amidase n=1 Tax=Geodermatophilus dictyosporus TaxID=1523247 RepID=A0A1I5QMS8_9ACTN|nr:amidase family protein [Geodermatophilus dictyosporus]SFP47156.1 amidase [Geodermatophilus dictyosporus]
MDASGAPGGARVVGLPATELAARVRAGELSAVAVVRAHLAHLADVEPRIGAFRVVRGEAALAEAAAVDAHPDRASLPLAGVPVAVKDNVAVAGETATDGGAVTGARPAAADHPVVARLRAAGAVVVGITRMPELGLYPTTDGPGTVTRNPWDTALSPGGSSGGSAAAVAAGVVPLAQGNDGLGSLRLPAAACGLVTLKPGRGVLPAGVGADDWSGMVVNGVLATTVTDVVLGTAVLAGEPPVPPADPGRPLRIAVARRSPLLGVRPDGPARGAVERTARLLREAGHAVVERDPVVPPGAALGGLARWFAGAEDDAAALGVDRSALLPRSRTHARLGRLARRAGLVRPATAERFRERTAAFFADSDLDVLLSPITNGPPLPARPWHERGFLVNAGAASRWAAWAPAWNLAGVPAVVVPVGTRAEGSPLAVQLVGPPGSETRLLWLAGELERRQPWRRHAPVFDPAGGGAGAPAGAPAPAPA